MKAFIFPGQGSQVVGMGREIYDSFSVAREVFQEVDDALGQNLTKLIFEGPETELTLTENAQPALMTVSLAILKVLEKEAGNDLFKHVKYVAGHSLGEYSALAAAKALTIADTARLLKIRGQAMQQAVPVGQGAMAAILGLDLDTVEQFLPEVAQKEICVIANDNSPGQVVISGHKEAVERAVAISKDKGAKRSLLLNVSAPFHCALMQPAAEKMREALENVNMSAPIVPLVSNVQASSVSDPNEIKNLLVQQVAGRVRWRESISWMAEQGIQQTVEIGAGKVLSGLSKRINGDLETLSMNIPADIESYLNRA